MKKKIELDMPDSVKALMDKKIAARDEAQKSKVNLSITSKVNERTKSKLACPDLVLDTKKGAFTKDSLANCEISMVYKEEDGDKEKSVKASGKVKFDAQSSSPEISTEMESVPIKSDSEDIRNASLRMKAQLTEDLAAEVYCPDISIDTINDEVLPESLKSCQTRLIMLDTGEVSDNPVLGAIKFSNPIKKNEDQDDDVDNLDNEPGESDS